MDAMEFVPEHGLPNGTLRRHVVCAHRNARHTRFLDARFRNVTDGAEKARSHVGAQRVVLLNYVTKNTGRSYL